MRAESTRSFGDRNEEAATAFLEARGYQIVERNYYAHKLGEIDIVAYKSGVVHFVEVKSSKGSFNPVYNLTPTKLQRVVRCAQYYLKSKRLTKPFCIDALLVRNGSIELLENITI